MVHFSRPLRIYMQTQRHTPPTPNCQQMHCLHLQEGFLDPFLLAPTSCSTNQKSLSDEKGSIHPFKIPGAMHNSLMGRIHFFLRNS